MTRILVSKGWTRGAAESAFCILNKKRSANGWIVAGLMIAGGILAAAGENDPCWMTGTIKDGLTDERSMTVAEQIRYKDEAFYYRHTDLGGGCKLSQSGSVAFRYVEEKNKSGDSLSCNGYLLDRIHTAKGSEVQLKSCMRRSYFAPNYNADCSPDFRPGFDLMPAKPLSLNLFLMQECAEKNKRWAESWNNGLAATLSF